MGGWEKTPASCSFGSPFFQNGGDKPERAVSMVMLMEKRKGCGGWGKENNESEDGTTRWQSKS